MNWKTWTAAALMIIVLFAIYVFAAPEPATGLRPARDEQPAARARQEARQERRILTTPGVEPVHTEWLAAQSGTYRSRRDLFSFPAPPPPPIPKPPPPPPDTDKDGVPDFRDNCVKVKNPDQQDIDHDGIGTACETEPEIAPPPPPPPKPMPPPFTYRYIGTFGSAANPIATFQREGEIVNARIGDVIDGKFILRSVGIESVEIGYVGFPPDEKQRIALAR